MNEAASWPAALRAEMKQDSLSAYIIPTSDFHDTEYVAEYFAARKHFRIHRQCRHPGGSGGQSRSVDRRTVLYSGSQRTGRLGYRADENGEEGTPTILQYLEENLKAGDTVGFDGRTVSFNEAREWKRKLAARDIQVETGKDLISRVWTDRPAMPATRTFPYPIAYAGKSVSEKLADVRRVMKEEGAKAHVITKIDEIIWLFNFRADDIPCFPAAYPMR